MSAVRDMFTKFGSQAAAATDATEAGWTNLVGAMTAAATWMTSSSRIVADSISASSIRWPLTLTWESRRPRNSISPSWPIRPKSPVR